MSRPSLGRKGPALAALFALSTLAASAAGCVNPRFVTASTGGPTQIKFFYVNQNGTTGIIKCQRTDDGSLSDCRRMRLVMAEH